MSECIECPGCKTKVIVTDHAMGVPGGQEKEQGYCPLCSELVAEFMTDGFISVKVSGVQHDLLQTIHNASRAGIPSPQHIVEAAANFIDAGLVRQDGPNRLRVTDEVLQALARNDQPLQH